MIRLILGLLMCAFSVCGYAQPARPGAAWYASGHVLLAVTEPGVGFSGNWQFDQAENGDMRVVKDEQRMGTQVSGTVLAICDDHALLLKDMPLPKGPPTNEIYGPVLMLQLALRLLERGLPQGPQALTGGAGMDVREQASPIRVKAGNSTSEFVAPWHMRGKVARLNPEQISFDMAFSYTTPAAQGRRLEMSLVGVWHARSRVPTFGNDMALDGWSIYRLDPVARSVGGVVLIERLAMLYRGSFRTLGDLRARIERGWQPNPRAEKRLECKL